MSRNSTTSTASSISSSSSTTLLADWHQFVLRKQYKDLQKLKQRLDAAFGEGQYKVKVRRDRFVLSVPRDMSPDELEELEEGIYQHY